MEIFKGWQANDWIGAYGALVATITFIWTAWLQGRDRHRLKVHIGVSYISPMDDPASVHTALLGGSVTNVGSRTAYVKSIGALLPEGNRSVYLPDPRELNFYEVPTFPHELAPGQSVGFRLPLHMVTRPNVVGFIATDSHDKDWQVPRKKFKAVVKSAKEEGKT